MSEPYVKPAAPVYCVISDDSEEEEELCDEENYFQIIQQYLSGNASQAEGISATEDEDEEEEYGEEEEVDLEEVGAATEGSNAGLLKQLRRETHMVKQGWSCTCGVPTKVHYKLTEEIKKEAEERGLVIMAVDRSTTGTKGYIMTTFLHAYNMISGQYMINCENIYWFSRKTLYEVASLGEDSHRPCKAYFDLEMSISHLSAELTEFSDITALADKMTDAVITLIVEFIKELFGVSLDSDKDFVVLCCTNRKKISRHLLIGKYGCFFRSIKHLHRFVWGLEAFIVENLVKGTSQKRPAGKAAWDIMYRAAPTDEAPKNTKRPLDKVYINGAYYRPFIDLCVYKPRGQLMRCWNSNKITDERPFKLLTRTRTDGKYNFVCVPQAYHGLMRRYSDSPGTKAPIVLPDIKEEEEMYSFLDTCITAVTPRVRYSDTGLVQGVEDCGNLWEYGWKMSKQRLTTFIEGVLVHVGDQPVTGTCKYKVDAYGSTQCIEINATKLTAGVRMMMMMTSTRRDLEAMKEAAQGEDTGKRKQSGGVEFDPSEYGAMAAQGSTLTSPSCIGEELSVNRPHYVNSKYTKGGMLPMHKRQKRVYIEMRIDEETSMAQVIALGAQIYRIHGCVEACVSASAPAKVQKMIDEQLGNLVGYTVCFMRSFWCPIKNLGKGGMHHSGPGMVRYGNSSVSIYPSGTYVFRCFSKRCGNMKVDRTASTPQLVQAIYQLFPGAHSSW